MVYKDGTYVAIDSYNNDINFHGSIWNLKGGTIFHFWYELVNMLESS